MKRNTLVIMIVVLALLVVGGYALPLFSTNTASAAAQPGTAPSAAVSSALKPALATDLESMYESIYDQVNPSVVKIDIVQNAAGSIDPNAPGFAAGPQQALGSGFVWDMQGDIVTNNHVIDGADQITVTFADGTMVDGKVVGADPSSDLAVVKVNAPAALLHPVQMADSAGTRVGELAIAIGNPYGEQNTMTTGIISALGRSVPVGDPSSAQGAAQGPSYTIPDVIQTDAPINPGNSGGVLLNSAGQVLGVTQSIESASGSSSGIGFAIPSEIVQKVAPALIQTGHYDHPYLGISGSTLTPDLAQAMGLKANQRGAMIGDVTPGGPADKAGLLGSTKSVTISGLNAQVGGDVVTAIDGQPVKSFDDLVSILARSTTVNQTVTVTILRDGKEQSVKVTLAARPTN